MMRLFNVWLFILWLNVDESLQQGVKQCGHPGDAQFADFRLEKGDDFVFGSKVVYTCHKGYQMMSRRDFRTCMADGWDGVVPVCEATQCPPISVENNIQVFGDTEEATFGNVVQFSCKSNREILEGSEEVSCDETGQWSSKPPTCTAVKCKEPVIPNGFVTERKQEYDEDYVLQFECNDKYKRSEDRDSRCMKTGQRADWSPTPGCELVKCSLNLPPVRGTSYTPQYTNLFPPGDSVTVRCADAYGITDLQVVTADVLCKDDGQWEIQPVCQEVTCLKQAPNVYYWYSSQRARIHETADYYCKQGYKKPRGVTRATCARGGWSPDPLCEEITCLPRQIPNTDLLNYKQQYKNREQAHYVCKNGFKGEFFQTCTENGWTGDNLCVVGTCLRRTEPDADIQNPKAEYRYNEQIHYVCKTGRGRFSLTCTEDGWLGFRKGSKPTDCGTPPPLPDGDIRYAMKSQYSHCEQVEYMCQTFYTMEGEPNRTCVDGEWTGHMRCLKPCIVNEDIFRQHNITLQTSDKNFFAHDEILAFKCVRGNPDGRVAMIQRCSSGEIFMPSCS